MHVVEGVDIGILDETFFFALEPLQSAPREEQANGMDEVPARVLMLEFHADAGCLESRLRAHQAHDGIAQTDERRLAIRAHERSQGKTQNHISAPAERHAGIRFSARTGRVVELGGPLNQSGRFGVEHELPAGVMCKPWTQPVPMLLHEGEGLARWAFRKKQRLAQEGAHGALTLVALLGVDRRLQGSEQLASAARGIHRRWRRMVWRRFFLHEDFSSPPRLFVRPDRPHPSRVNTRSSPRNPGRGALRWR